MNETSAELEALGAERRLYTKKQSDNRIEKDFGKKMKFNLSKVADLIRVLNFFRLDMGDLYEMITPLGGPHQPKQLPYITQMKPQAFQIFIDLLEMIDNIDGYGDEIGLVKTFDAAKDKFESDRAALRAKKSKSSAAAAAAAAPAEPKVEVLPPLWHTRISRSTGKIVYQHPHCHPTYTHPRELTYKLLDKLIQKRFDTLTQKKKEEEQNWVITSSKSKNGYVKYIADSGNGKAQYENPWAKSTSQLASLHRDTRKKSNSGASAAASSSTLKKRKRTPNLKVDSNKLAKLASLRKKKRGGKRKTKRKTNKRKKKKKSKKRRK